MKKILAALFAVGIVATAVAFSRNDAVTGFKADAENRNPWTHDRVNSQPDEFQFAIVSDRTGSHRAQVFSRAVDRLNLLQPEFVVSVGDLIEGGNKPPEKVTAEWEEFDGYVRKLTMPFFYVPGNHDVANPNTFKVWGERLGRRYYHFVYRNVLFLCLNTDDPANPNDAEEKSIGSPAIRKEQLDYAKKVLADVRDVRHTLVFVHKPIWTATNLAKRGWLDVEKALADRPYTVFCGHVHRYRKYVRQGRDYYQLATTGGGSRLRGIPYGEFDHIVWVTMKREGPVLANIMLDSVLSDELKVPESTEAGVKLPQVAIYPVRGTVYYRGSPLAGAYVAVTRIDQEGQTGPRGFSTNAITEGDGSFQGSTYKGFDGLPAGKYTATVVQSRPFLNPDGTPGPNILPAKFAKAATSGLTFEVKPGEDNEIVLDLKD